MKYDYEEKTEKLGEFKLIKFKNGQSAVKEGLVLSIEKDKKTVSQLLYFILRNEMTKVSVFEGFLLPKTQLKSLGNECSWKLEVIRIKGKDQNEEGKLNSEREVVKLQFEDAEKAKEFSKIIEDMKPKQM